MDLPIMTFYTGEFLRKTQGWTAEECGALVRLYVSQWVNGALPQDEVRMAAIAGVTVQRFRVLWKLLGREFATAEPNGSFHPGLVSNQLDSHRKRSFELARKHRNGAAKTNADRWGTVVPFAARDKP